MRYTSPVQEGPTKVYLQDYNASALDLVFPNFILSWYIPPAPATFRNTVVPNENETDKDASTLLPPDPFEPAELPVMLELKAASASSLYHPAILLWIMVWFDLEKTSRKYDVVVT
ncbi:hypothetical protein WG66_008046 [Moniliophthora roreri]|nr:hypothetical protein WG66_008046 [Moniliophthora roreri]